jgi:hypothetical protein
MTLGGWPGFCFALSHMTDPVSTPLQLTIHPLPEAASKTAFWSEDTPSFADMLDVINPLQHIPIISSIYQALTGDTQSAAAKIVGGGLFGGPLGLLASIFDAIIEQQTGTGVSGNLLAAVTGNDVPALHPKETETASIDSLPPHQRVAYNAYVQSQSLLS